ncbi:MAG: hypothetical protein BIFFINMI_01374 [Phycisphaerae bacterium]|nr:hypothetical protein [Phycisphaerae bacterium]
MNQQASKDGSERARQTRLDLAGAAVCFALAVVLLHGVSLHDPLFLDDHLHHYNIARMGYRPSDLINATTIRPGEFLEAWWQQKPIQWVYPRPAATLLAKAVYDLSGGSLVAMHAVSLALHWATTFLVFLLCRGLTRNYAWSLIGGLLFAVYPHATFAVGWLAAQNIVLATALMLGALLLWVRASGLDIHAGPRGPLASPEGQGGAGVTAAAAAPPLRLGSALGVVGLWVVALFSRENAVMLPAVMAAFDTAFGGWRWLWKRRWVYAAMAVIGVGYLAWRLVFHYSPLPAVYYRAPEAGWVYPFWFLAKLLHYVVATIWLSPMTIGPSGRYNPWLESPGDCLLMLGVLAVMSGGYWMATRRARGWWIWPLWVLLAVLPVTPVLATPHSGYLPGVGYAVAMVLAAGLLRHLQPPTLAARASRYVVVWFLAATISYVPIYRYTWAGMIAAEQLTTRQIAAEPPGAGVTDLYFINMPFANVYEQLQLQERDCWGRAAAGVRCHVLTVAPDVLRMEDPCDLRQLDGHSFTLTIRGDRYFSGLLGRYLVQAMRTDGPLRAGQSVRGDGYDVLILDASPAGVRSLRFTFDRPLADASCRFYLGSRVCSAARIAWSAGVPQHAANAPETLAQHAVSLQNVQQAAVRLDAGDARAAGDLLAGLASDDADVRSAARAALQPVVEYLAEATGAAPPQADCWLDPAAGQEARLADWWTRTTSPDPTMVRRLWTQRDCWADVREARDRYYSVMAIVRAIVQSDMYLTGPPYPGPEGGGTGEADISGLHVGARDGIEGRR